MKFWENWMKHVREKSHKDEKLYVKWVLTLFDVLNKCIFIKIWIRRILIYVTLSGFFVKQILSPKASVDVFWRTNQFTTCEPSSPRTNPGSVSTNTFHSDIYKRLHHFTNVKINFFSSTKRCSFLERWP